MAAHTLAHSPAPTSSARPAPNRTLVVGAGLAGAVYARTLADAGIGVDVIDRRSHVAGNAYDEVNEHGVRVHRYGPHLFHTSNKTVLAWIARFAEWTPYEHKVRALLPSSQLVPLPINLDTINQVFGTSLSSSAEVESHLAKISVRNDKPGNAAEYLASKIGVTLRDLFFRPYTRKMWGLDLEELSPSVVQRIPMRNDRRDTYFRETETQLLPRVGYTPFVQNILNHPLITVALDTPFDRGMTKHYDYCFLSMAIDEFYQDRFGPLPYRSLRFHHEHKNVPISEGPWRDEGARQLFSVVNFTDAGPFTRETAWHRLPHHWVHRSGVLTFTKEEPCDYLDNGMERYYPVKDADRSNEATYEKYRAIALDDAAKLSFIGRCGTYRYLDMDQVINQSLTGAGAWLRSYRADPNLQERNIA